MTKAKDHESGLTMDRLCELITYDPKTGNFYWLITSGRCRKGELAGSLKPSGYITINIDNHRHRAHRLAWFFMLGEWPKEQVDHKNNVRSDNRWDNLREANNTQNQYNAKLSKNNKSGYKGVYWNTQRQKWHATLDILNRRIHGGFYDNVEDAAAAYKKLIDHYHGEFARTE